MQATGTVGTAPMRDRFVLLDGMRGVAAVAILFYHLAWQAGLEKVLFGHAYLAVDFFFMLSGFVIADAYQRKLESGTMSVADFVKTRVVRLYPMIFVGALFALALRLVATRNGIIDEDFATTMLRSAADAVLEPLHRDLTDGSVRFGFPLNEPLWSLFWEAVANLAYALLAPRIGPRALVSFALAAAVALVAFALTHNGLDRGHQGWLGGFLRVSFAFPTGIALWHLRASLPPRFRLPLLLQLALLTLVMALPRPPHVNAVYDAAIVLVIFPVIIAAASRTSLGGATNKVALVLGAVSYPLYVVHDPFMQLFKAAFDQLRLSRPAAFAAVLVLAALIVLMSYLLLRFVDEPLRARWRKMLGTTASARGQTAP